MPKGAFTPAVFALCKHRSVC